MSRRRRSYDSAMLWRVVLIFSAVLIVMVLVFGWRATLYQIADSLGIELPPTVPLAGEPQDVEPVSGSYYAVYFTDPVIPFDNVTTGGIEDNLIELINGAQSTIDVAVYEFDLQNVGEALIAAHRRNVQVRIVYDEEGALADPQMQQMIDAGIPAEGDRGRSAIMHNKFFVIDGHTVWLGTWNVTINDTYKNNNVGMIIRSTQLAQNYTAEFEEMYNGQFGAESPANTPNPVFTLNGVRIENYFAPEDDVMPHLVDLVNSAQRSIHFMAFSFTDDSLGEAMLDRAAANVEVSGIFEQVGANTEYSQCRPMLDAAVNVRLDGNPSRLHFKVIIVDSSIVAVGSFNFTGNAATTNDENLVIVYDPGLAAAFEEEFNRQMAISVQPVGGQCLAG